MCSFCLLLLYTVSMTWHDYFLVHKNIFSTKYTVIVHRTHSMLLDTLFLIFLHLFFSGCKKPLTIHLIWLSSKPPNANLIWKNKIKIKTELFIKWDTTQLSELRQSAFGWTGSPAAVCKTWENVLICTDAKVNANKQTACQSRDSSLYLTLDRLLEFIKYIYFHNIKNNSEFSSAFAGSRQVRAMFVHSEPQKVGLMEVLQHPLLLKIFSSIRYNTLN